jgi:acetylserotonin N-methyltransferase
MELSAVCEVARQHIADGGVSDRVDTVAIDMLRDPWPTGYDGIFFSNVFHDWTEETNSQLARSAFAALPSDGRIFLHEALLNEEGDGPLTVASFSMLMLLANPGRQYTFRELSSILRGAGFEDVRSRPSYGYYSLVSARKP